MIKKHKMLNRRLFGKAALGAALLGAAPLRALAAEEPAIGDDGMHKQPWLLDSFLELPDDLATAAENGKGLIVLFEQRGCPYCRELHRVNFSDPRIVERMTGAFEVVQLDLWGSREVVDLDGESMEERDLARKWRVNFTPTTVFITAEPKPAGERFRLPGYFKPFHYHAGLDFVASGAHREQNFQRFLQGRFAALEAEGISPDVW